MAQYIPKEPLMAEIDRIVKEETEMFNEQCQGGYEPSPSPAVVCMRMEKLRSFLNTLELKDVDLYNNGWIDCTKQMPPETKQTSDTLQGHREWTESEPVLAWDSSYGARIDSTRNGKWRSEQIRGCTGQLVHGIIAWRPIPEFSEELLLKAQKGE